MRQPFPSKLTEREQEEYAQQKESFKLQSAHEIEIKKLELALEKTKTSWKSLLRVPITIIKLPVALILGIAYIVCMVRGIEPSERFWNFIDS